MAEVVWHQSDWQWDPIAMVAKPAESKARLAAGLHQESQMRSASESEVDDKLKMQNPKLAVVCQVPGCPADLYSMREYHQRYKICEFHLKAPTVLKDSRAQRFCQQCGKFQGVEEFDGDKRSCRARLDKHNARRRRQRELHNMLKRGIKLDPKAVMESYDVGDEEELASKLSKLQKAGFSLDTAQGASAGEAPAARARPARARRSATRATATAPIAEEAEEQKMMLPPLDTSASGEAAQLAGPVGSADIASLGSATSTQQLMAPQPFAGGLPDPSATLEFLTADLGLLDDDFLDAVLAPAVLPGQAAAQAGGEFSPAPFLQVDPSQIMDLDDMAILEEITQEFGLADPGAGATPPAIPPAVPSMAPYGSVASTSTLLPPAPYQQRGAQAPPILPPFEQAPAGFSLPQGLGGDMMDVAVTPSAPYGGLNDNHQTPAAGSVALPPFMATGPPPSESSRISSATASNLDVAAGNAMSVIDEALNLLNYDTAQVTYIPEDRLFRFSAKLFNCTPDQLPSDLKASLINMLTCNSLEGYIRPGCVHVTVDALMGPEEREAMATHGVRGVVERLVAQQPEAFWAQHTMLVQLGDKMALVREGQVVHVLATAGSTQVFPRIAALRPLVAAPETDGTCRVTVWGYNLEGGEEGGDVVLARSQGKYVAVERVGEVASDPSWNGMQRMELRVAGVELGALQIEIMRGGFISSSKTLLVHIDPLLSAELRQLESDQTGMDVDTTLFELGRVVEFGGGARTTAGWGPEELSKAGKAARRMLAFAIQRKWVGVTRALLAGIAADCRALDAVAVADVMAAGTTGMPLLQLAVRTQSRELVGALLAWGRANRYSFKATTPGRRGLTSLHLAALIRDQGVIAGMITEMCDDAVSGWETAAAEDGTTPMAFAQAHGNAEVIRHLIASKLAKKGAAPAPVPVTLPPLASKPAALAPPAAAPAAENPGAAAAPSPSSLAEKPASAAGPAPVGNPAANPGPGTCSPAKSESTALPASPKKNDKTNHTSAAAAASPPSPHKPSRTSALDTASSSSSVEQFDYVHDSAKSMLVRRKGGEVGDGLAPATGEEEEDEIAREKAEAKRRRQRAMHAHSAALTFRDPLLEAKYAKWYHSGQVPVDVAFIMIAVLSQGAWIFRWSMEHSALGVCMVALMAMNAALVQMACLFPAKYRQYREALCVLSHIVHKVVQLLVTVTPPVGTIYSSTYNSTVAILESSSFAQVMMLSFGIKMRFAFHVFVNLFHLAVSAIVNDRICSAAWPRIPGGLCHAGLLAFQLGACFLLPCALVYLTERRSRRIFLETVAD